MSIDMFPDAAVDYLIHHSDPQSTPDGKVKMFVLVPLGPLFEVYGYESDVAEHADLNKDAIYFWAEGDAEDFAPELSEDEYKAMVRTFAIATFGPTAAENSGANPPSMADGIPSGPGVETAEREQGMICARCNTATGNNSQGHYWALCKALLDKGVYYKDALREHHFCCPGNCELETDSEQSGPGVETADEGMFVVDGVTPWRPLEVLDYAES